jgi:hypothetical protein
MKRESYTNGVLPDGFKVQDYPRILSLKNPVTDGLAKRLPASYSDSIFSNRSLSEDLLPTLEMYFL